MKIFTSSSIKNKLIGIILLVTSFAVIAGFTFDILRANAAAKTDLRSYATLYAKLIGEFCVAPLRFDDEQEAAKVLAKMKSLPSLDSGYVYDDNGDLFAAFERTDGTSAPRLSDVTEKAIFEGVFLHTYEPIIYNNQKYGTIYLRLSTSGLDQTIREYALVTITIIIALIGISYLLALKLQEVISKPILELADVTDKISTEEDYSLRAQKHSDDEIGLLYDRFNKMLEQIDTRDKELRNSSERFRALLETASESIVVVNEKGSIVIVNVRTEELFGYSRKELLGQSLEMLLPEHIREIHPDHFNSYCSDPRSRPMGDGLDVFALHKDGTEIPVEISLSYIRAENGILIMSFITDITNRKQAEEERIRLARQLQRSQKLETIGTLTGGIAHDFNNILTPIMGYAEMARRKLVPSSNHLAPMLDNILKAAQRAKELVYQILLFSKQVENERKPVRIQLLVIEAIKLVRASIPVTVEIRQQIESSCHPVLADATQIHQVIINLCTNAWQAMEEKGGTLTIELKQAEVDAAIEELHPNLCEGEYLLLSVTDTGNGMDDATLNRIFEPFFTTKTVDKGTGMGLSVVHGIVRSHNGDILVSSELGGGSTFDVYLPITRTEQNTATEGAKEIKMGQESLLIVDDENAVIGMLKEMLEQLGYRIDAQTSSIEAVKVFRQHPDKYDLVISDFTMPSMTGLELSRQLQEIRSGIPFMLMTGRVDMLTDDTIKEFGIKKVIGKPILTQELASAIREVLDR